MTIRFVMSVCPSVCSSHEATRLPLDAFLWNLVFEDFYISCQVLLESDKNDGHFTWRPMYLYISLNCS